MKLRHDFKTTLRLTVNWYLKTMERVKKTSGVGLHKNG